MLIICQAQFDSILLGVLLNDTIISANINVIPTDTSTSSSTDPRITELQRECVHAYAASHTTTIQLRLLDQFLGVSGSEGVQACLYFRRMGKPTLGPTQGQYSIVVEIFGAFGRPPSDVRLNLFFLRFLIGTSSLLFTQRHRLLWTYRPSYVASLGIKINI